MMITILLTLLALAQEPVKPPVAAHMQVDHATALKEAVEWLVNNQEKTGAWGSHHSPRPIEVLCDVPGSHHAFRLATTGLCIMALNDSPYKTEKSEAALHKGIDYLLADRNVKRPSGMEHYSVWAFGYGLRCVSEILLTRPEYPRAKDLRDTASFFIEKLGRYQSLDGGWGYLSIFEFASYQPSATSMSFTTATILVGLQRAQQAGIEIPERLKNRALDAVQRCRNPDGSWNYGELWRKSPVHGVNQLKGSACRAPVCQYSLEIFGREAPVRELEAILENLLVRYARFQEAGLRRPIPHESWYAISGYFYLYGQAYASLLLDRITPHARKRYAPLLEQAILKTRQPDGSFWDYPLYSYHKPYGTAYAIMVLARTRSMAEAKETEAELTPAPSY